MNGAGVFSGCAFLSEPTMVKTILTTQRERLQTNSQNEHLVLRIRLQLRISRTTLQHTATQCKTLHHVFVNITPRCAFVASHAETHCSILMQITPSSARFPQILIRRHKMLTI